MMHLQVICQCSYKTAGGVPKRCRLACPMLRATMRYSSSKRRICVRDSASCACALARLRALLISASRDDYG